MSDWLIDSTHPKSNVRLALFGVLVGVSLLWFVFSVVRGMIRAIGTIL